MSHWQDRFLGSVALTRELSAFEQRFFEYPPEDIDAICQAFRPKYRIAVALQLGFMRLTGGRLDEMNVVPRGLLKSVGEQLGQTPPNIATLRSMYRRVNTRREHQAWVMQRLGIRGHSKRQENMLLAAMREASHTADSLDRLVAKARQWLFDKQLLIPAERTLHDLCARAAGDTEAAAYRAICAVVTPDQRQAWEEALLQKHKHGRTRLDWLQQAPKKRAPKNARELFDKISFITALGVAQADLSGVSRARLQHYARRLQHRRPSRLRTLGEVTRTLETVSFLHIALSEASDTVVQLAGKATSDVMSRALEAVKRAQAATLADCQAMLHKIFALAQDEKLEAETVRTKLLAMAREWAPRVYPSRAAAIRAQLAEPQPPVRTWVRQLTTLNIQGKPTERAIQGLRQLKSLYADQKSALPEGSYDCSKGWTKLIEGEPDRERALRALEMSTLTELRKGFRRGSCWLDHSRSYRNRDQMLISPDLWKLQRSRHLSMLRLPARPEEYIQGLVAAADTGIERIAQALARGELTVSEGELHLPALTAEALPAGVAEARRALSTQVGPIQLPDLLLEMDLQTRFSKTLLGRAPVSEHELMLTYAALLAHGTELDATGVSLMMPGVSAVQISAAMTALEADAVIGNANQLLMEFVGQIPLSRHWGDGKSASSDMMSVATSRHLWNARLDPRRKTPSIGLYTHVHNQWPIIYNQPIVLGERQVGAAIEGVVRQTSIDLEVLAVDTHSDVGMWVAASQGFDLCPRLKNLAERRLTLPKGARVPESLKAVVDKALYMECVKDQWDDLLRVAASISNGTVSAVLVLQRFGSAAQGDRLYRAAKTLGRLLRTIYLCDYFTKPEFRREIHRVLNRGESVHTLQRAIHFGEVPQERGRRSEEMIAISGSLSLLTNLVIGWTASKMQTGAAILSAQGTVISPEVWRHISPARHANVNFRGTFKFALEKYGALWREEGSGNAVRGQAG